MQRGAKMDRLEIFDILTRYLCGPNEIAQSPVSNF